MALTDSGANNPEDSAGPGSNGTGPGGRGALQSRGTPSEPRGGPILSALQRQQMDTQVSAPGPGNMADSLGKLKIAIDLMGTALHGFEPGSGQYKDIQHALENLSRHLPESGNQSGLEETHLIDLLRKSKQNPVMQALSGVFGGHGRGGGGGQQPPNPSTPLPGA